MRPLQQCTNIERLQRKSYVPYYNKVAFKQILKDLKQPSTLHFDVVCTKYLISVDMALVLL